VLVVEDDPSISHFVVRGLREEQYRVDLAEDGLTAEQMAGDGCYDAIVLDVLLPGLDGFSLCRRLRRDGVDTPVLMLTARDAVPDRVHGLDVGADDYLVKPFAFSELLARIRTLLRRGAVPAAAQEQRFRLADLEVDLVRRRVVRAGERIDLTAKEYALLDYFVRHSGEVVSRTLIAEHVWDMNFDSDTNVVDVAVRRLRAKVDDAFGQKLIHTIRGVGYVFDARDE